MKEEVPDRRLNDLLLVLDRLTVLHRELLTLIQNKIERMRTGNIDEVGAVAQHEECLIKTIAEQEGLRKQLMDAIGRGYGISPPVARNMSARQLAERLEGSLRTRLLEAAEQLKNAAREVADVNRVATLIAQQVLGHLRCVFEAVAAPDQPPDTYSPRGAMVPGSARRLFEMTG